ncbi:2'-5' RNA ligase family protein [soil metagenome]
MPKLHALELLPDVAGETAVRRSWQALHDAGLPSMLDHKGSSNTPHVTVIALPEISPVDEQLAVELLEPLLPVRAGLSGLAVFGGARVTLARVVDVPDEVVAAVLRLRGATTGHAHPGWLAHATLGRRIPREELQRAVDAVGLADEEFTLTGLRRWDPDADAVRVLTGEAFGP